MNTAGPGSEEGWFYLASYEEEFDLERAAMFILSQGWGVRCYVSSANRDGSFSAPRPVVFDWMARG